MLRVNIKYIKYIKKKKIFLLKIFILYTKEMRCLEIDELKEIEKNSF